MPEMGASLEKWCLDEAEVRRRRWPRRWNEMPTPSAHGPKPSLRAIRKGWFLSRLVVHARVGRRATS